MKKIIFFLLTIYFLQGTSYGAFNFVDNGDGTVTDARTGLVWLKNANPCGYKSWYDAGTYCATLSNGSAGLSDGSVAGQWRLPSIEELEGIGTDPPVTWEFGNPIVTWTKPSTPFLNLEPSSYWSSTSYLPNTDFALDLQMNGGNVHNTVKTLALHGSVWPVRNKFTPRFTDNNNGTVTDTRTGLVWLKNANPCGLKNWADAVTYCNSLANNTAGLTDGSIAGQWRLPSKTELQGIGTDPPAIWESGSPTVPWTIPGAPFTGVESDFYRSSTPGIDNTGGAWVVEMGNGSVNGYYGSDHNFFVWPVRAVDIDGDSIFDYKDNCLTIYNPDQADDDNDGIGNECDVDYLRASLQQTKADLDECKNPTVVQMSSFEAQPSNKSVTLKWKTESEIDNAGFNIWRAEGFKKITPAIIPAQGSATEGSEYDYLDLDVFNRKPYFYLLEDIDTNGLSTFHGPVKTVPRAVYVIGK